MSAHLNHIQHNAAPNIQAKANQHIPAGITYALRKGFSITPTKNRTRLYHKIAQLFHTDHLESRVNKNSGVGKHCSLLVIQMSALIKNISVQALKLEQSEFEKL
ncbi:MAG: hypothetical protein NXI01_03500 [Gammaproteobacteria bacterium]|nr:hypothetical protein [Gammaproteobacteria bacterium]